MQEVIHYSHSLSLSLLKSEGQGDCGQSGMIIGYWGLVKGCEKCKRIIEKEKKEIAKHRKDRNHDR